MADPLFADLPGAPPASDTDAWAPHQGTGPSGAVPDAVPFQPRFVDPANLTPVQRHAMKQAIASGDQAEYQRFLAGLDGQPNAGASGVLPAVEAPAAEVEEPPDPEVEAIAGKLEEHGSALEVLEPLFAPAEAFQERLAAIPDEQRQAYLETNVGEIIGRQFHGNEAAFDRALQDIAEAAKLVGIDPDSIGETHALCDPAIFQRAHLMALNVLRNRKAE